MVDRRKEITTVRRRDFEGPCPAEPKGDADNLEFATVRNAHAQDDLLQALHEMLVHLTSTENN